MFSMPSSFSDFFYKSLKTLPYVAVFNGVLFCAIGTYLIYSENSFTANSIKTQLHVVKVENSRGDNGPVYRPLFEALENGGKTIRYSGNTWVSPKPHEEGDVVEGRINWATGEMRSVDMMKMGSSMGKTSSVAGVILFVFGLIYLLRQRIRAFFKLSNLE